MSKLLEILDSIIVELDSLSDEQLQKKFESAKGGLISSMVMDGQQICHHHQLDIPLWSEFFSSNYDVSFDDVSLFYKTASVDQEMLIKHGKIISRISDVFIEAAEAANDEHYLMAA